MEKRHRVFIAINLPPEIKKFLARYSEKLPELPAKWTPKDNLHITVEFLGDLTDVEIASVCKIAGEVAARHEVFPLNINKIVYGPPKKDPPKMVWAEAEKSRELINLKKDLEDSLSEEIDVKPEGHGFVTHITLAKIMEWEFRKFDLDERPEINEDVQLEFSVESIDVMESELKKGGPVYTMLESHQLII